MLVGHLSLLLRSCPLQMTSLLSAILPLLVLLSKGRVVVRVTGGSFKISPDVKQLGLTIFNATLVFCHLYFSMARQFLSLNVTPRGVLRVVS